MTKQTYLSRKEALERLEDLLYYKEADLHDALSLEYLAAIKGNIAALREDDKSKSFRTRLYSELIFNSIELSKKHPYKKWIAAGYHSQKASKDGLLQVVKKLHETMVMRGDDIAKGIVFPQKDTHVPQDKANQPKKKSYRSSYARPKPVAEKKLKILNKIISAAGTLKKHLTASVPAMIGVISKAKMIKGSPQVNNPANEESLRLTLSKLKESYDQRLQGRDTKDPAKKAYEALMKQASKLEKLHLKSLDALDQEGQKTRTVPLYPIDSREIKEQNTH